MSVSSSAHAAALRVSFAACAVCGSDGWSIAYEGPIRDGAFGRVTSGLVGRCNGCGVERLDEALCLKDAAYVDEDYRRHVGQDHDLARHFAAHDELARFTLDTLWPVALRGKTIADIGCGGGSLLDHVRGLPDQAVAIDPDRTFARSLQGRAYRWYETARSAAADFAGRIDVAFSVQVIEHVTNPREFLADIAALLKPEGLLILSTPNRGDILMDLLPDDFPAFFYRTQHRWYFDAVTLSHAIVAAGLRVREIRHVHRYGFANAVLWLRDRKPSGRSVLSVIDREADALWKAWLERSGRADNLYILAERAP